MNIFYSDSESDQEKTTKPGSVTKLIGDAEIEEVLGRSIDSNTKSGISKHLLSNNSLVAKVNYSKISKVQQFKMENETVSAICYVANGLIALVQGSKLQIWLS